MAQHTNPEDMMIVKVSLPVVVKANAVSYNGAEPVWHAYVTLFGRTVVERWTIDDQYDTYAKSEQEALRRGAKAARAWAKGEIEWLTTHEV